MDAFFLTNLTTPPLLFFLLGASAAVLRSDLEIPEQVAKFMSLYLLFAIGFKGGVALAQSNLGLQVLTSLLAALILASVIPFYVFFILRRALTTADAAATAATYGSISAVTFVTSTSYLDSVGVVWSGHLVAAMALMESPAIIIGLMLYRLAKKQGEPDPIAGGELFRDSVLNGSVFLIVGSLVIGWITGVDGKAQIGPFVDELFIGVLCLFLLDMGIVSMHRLQDMRASAQAVPIVQLVAWGIGLPLLNGALAAAFALGLGLSEGDSVLLIVLGASASYIAVPAALRLSLPEANPSVYLAMSLAITFPFNLMLGIPLYHQIVIWLT